MDTINNNMVFPFSRINVNAMNVTFGQSDTITNRNANYISNNDVFKQIDLDLHMHSIRQQCKSYSEDEFNEKFADSQHISLIHVNICSSKKNLRNFMCSINNLNIKFSFIVLSEMWGYSHIYGIKESRNGGGVSIYVVDCINYKKRLDLKLDKSYFESYFIEMDKNVFKLKSNVIIGALYKPSNS